MMMKKKMMMRRGRRRGKEKQQQEEEEEEFPNRALQQHPKDITFYIAGGSRLIIDAHVYMAHHASTPADIMHISSSSQHHHHHPAAAAPPSPASCCISHVSKQQYEEVFAQDVLCMPDLPTYDDSYASSCTRTVLVVLCCIPCYSYWWADFLADIYVISSDRTTITGV